MSLLLPILVFLIFYFFIIKPKQAKLKASQAEQARIAEGDRVLTRAGIYGRVSRLSNDLAVVEVAPNVELVFDRRSVLKAPESVDVESQLSGEEFDTEFSDDDFSRLHDHLESHSGTGEDVETENPLPTKEETSADTFSSESNDSPDATETHDEKNPGENG